MLAVRALARFFAVPDDPDLVRAQVQAFSRQLPLMYVIVVANTLMLAATHDDAPPLLRFYIPLIIVVVCKSRLVLWLRTRNVEMTVQQARKRMNGTIVLSALSGLTVSGWALSLLPYGNAFQQSHVAFYISITCICCMFSLMHCRAAVALMALCTMLPFSVAFVSMNNLIFLALTFNLALVIASVMSILLNSYKTFGALVASRSAITQKQAEAHKLSEQNFQLANIDSLTGLPNHRSFGRDLAQALAKATADGTEVAVARINLDSFKSVNNIFGSITGDRVLQDVAHRINVMRHSSMVAARLGSDNFALIMPGHYTEAQLAAFGTSLTMAMRPSFQNKLGTVHISASAGFAMSKPGDTPDTLYDRADYATWVAKREARGQAVVFSDRHAADLSKARTMEHALMTANLDEEIYILFQPQFDVMINRITGFEVLARWRSPLLGEVSPGEFIPLAERMGTISKITQAVLGKALEASTRLPQSLRLSVNLSANDLGSATAIEAIAALVESAGKPTRVDFEITETAVMRDIEQASQGLLTLLRLGSRIALDDFGTGHSSLTHVQKLPLDRIKVDRSFVAEVTNDPTSRAIVQTTIDLCRNLGISCVFEGIETEEQLQCLQAMGGRLMQGYLFGRPMSEDHVFQLMDQQEDIEAPRTVRKTGAAG